MNLIKKSKDLYSLLGLVGIGIVTIGYILGESNFAEIHLQLPFLNFPIFIGEGLFFLCLLCLIGVVGFPQKSFFELNRWNKIFWVYAILIVSKALFGYLAWGPLALRHSALFYYPVFALFGYLFFKKEFINQIVAVVLCVFILGLIKCPLFNSYWLLTCFLLVCVLVKSFSNRILQALILILLLWVTPYKYFFTAARMMIVSNFIAVLFVIFSLGVIFIENKFAKVLCVFLGVFILVFGFTQLSDRNALDSIVNGKKMFRKFREYDVQVEKDAKQFEKKSINKVTVYNSNRTMVEKNKNRMIVETKNRLMLASMQSGRDEDAFNHNISENKKYILLIKSMIQDISVEKIEERLGRDYENWKEEEVQEIYKEIIIKEIVSRGVKINLDDLENIFDLIFTSKKNIIVVDKKIGRNLEGMYVNALFRLFIWRDMFVELLAKKPVLGFSFGRPLRSVSLEILHWGESAWSRDGWIAPHNSYLHIVYRLGLAGLAFISGVFLVLLKMIKEFASMKSLVGILLCAIIINWFVAANFLLILELPYTSIPIWTIFGMTFAYCKSLERD